MSDTLPITQMFNVGDYVSFYTHGDCEYGYNAFGLILDVKERYPEYFVYEIQHDTKSYFVHQGMVLKKAQQNPLYKEGDVIIANFAKGNRNGNKVIGKIAYIDWMGSDSKSLYWYHIAVNWVHAHNGNIMTTVFEADVIGLIDASLIKGEMPKQRFVGDY